MDASLVADLAITLTMIMLLWKGLKALYWGLKSANAAMDQWPWWWPKSDRHYNPPA